MDGGMNLRKPNSIEIKYGLNCQNCAYNSVCKYTLEKSQPAEWICKYYANEEKGEFANPKDKAKISK